MFCFSKQSKVMKVQQLKLVHFQLENIFQEPQSTNVIIIKFFDSKKESGINRKLQVSNISEKVTNGEVK